MGSEKYPTNRAIAPGVGNMSGIGGVLASREVELCTPPALQELCMHCCAELVPFSRESCWVLDELKMVWFGVRKNRWHKFLFTVFKKKNCFKIASCQIEVFYSPSLIWLDQFESFRQAQKPKLNARRLGPTFNMAAISWCCVFALNHDKE